MSSLHRRECKATPRIPLETQLAHPLSGDHQGAAFAALSPNRALPPLVNGDFRLSECSALLKYLAERTECGGPAGPPQATRQADFKKS